MDFLNTRVTTKASSKSEVSMRAYANLDRVQRTTRGAIGETVESAVPALLSHMQGEKLPMPKQPRSLRSENSNQERLEPKLLRAVEANDVVQAKTIIDEALATRQLSETFLSIGLIRACDRNLVDIARFLLRAGANANHVSGSGNRLTNLRRAAESGHLEMAQVLIDHNADLEARDKKGRTALMTCAWKGHVGIVELLLAKGARVGEVDYKQRNVLHNIAAGAHDERTSGPLGLEIVRHLLQAGVDVDATDELGRTALHWSTVTDNMELMKLLLTTRFGGASPKARTNAVDKRMKTPLHLAASHDRQHLAEILLQHGADVHARSDGGWSVLHNACMHGTGDFVQLMLDAGADVNCELLNGRTPLHVAAEQGNLEAAACLLRQPQTKRSVKDRFGTTPLLLAAQYGKMNIAEMLAPWNRTSELSQDEIEAAKQFSATIVDFGNFKNTNRVQRKSVYELLYARDPRNPSKHAISTLPQKTKATNFRWIHLPANNVMWAETLMTKRFLEEGAVDVEGFKALETSFNHQHRGQLHHSRFMRPMVQVVHRTQTEPEEMKSEKGDYPKVIVEEPAQATTATATGSSEVTSSGAPKNKKSQRHAQSVLPKVAGAEEVDALKQNSTDSKNDRHEKTTPTAYSDPTPKGSRKAPKRNDTASTTALSESSNTSKPGKKPNAAASKPRKSPRDEPLRPHSRKSIDKAAASPSQRGLHNSCNIFMFMPYLHFETDSRRRAMQDAIEDPERLFRRVNAQADEVLIRAHLSRSSSFLHVRRTLDQYYYHNIETRKRDSDQVVYRFQKKHRSEVDGVDPKVFMVDQLWMWVLGKDLVITSFPQRWRQPRNDPLNVLEGIIEDINSKTRDPVQNVYELTMTIAGRCFGTFDRHRKGDDDYQFFDMFESSIGAAMDGEATLFQEFSHASRQASSWLQSHQRLEGRSRQPMFFDKLLDVGAETDLLAEIKDIRDELDIIKMVLDHQHHLLPELRDAIRNIYRDERSHAALRKVEKGFEEQEKNITNPLKDLSRMDSQAGRIYESIRDLLDLKQKHANAFEARYAREQATGTQRQGQTIMVFTIVTVIFLPLSFVAAFFAINVKEFPHSPDGNGQQEMSLSYVSAYVFGIGLAISLPCIAVALSIDECNALIADFKKRFREKFWPIKQQRSGEAEAGDELFPMDHTLSIAKSLRRSMDVSWDGNLRRPPRKSAEVSWGGAYTRRRMSKPEWDVEGGRHDI